jgi:hypothetical protein
MSGVSQGSGRFPVEFLSRCFLFLRRSARTFIDPLVRLLFTSLLLIFQLRTPIPEQLLRLSWKPKRQILTAEMLSG